MRIISKFRDYYDSVQAHGLDPSVMYIRKEEPIVITKNSNKTLVSLANGIRSRGIGGHWINGWINRGYPFTDYLVLFCGRLYPGISIVTLEKGSPRLGYTEKVAYLWSQNVDIHLLLEKAEVPVNKINSYGFSIVDYFNFFKQYSSKDLLSIHSEYDVPILLLRCERYDGVSCYSNPNLSAIQFEKRIDPFTAFQELAMFIGGVMGGKSPKTVEISDKVRAEKHGFDKWSFRKLPTKQ